MKNLQVVHRECVGDKKFVHIGDKMYKFHQRSLWRTKHLWVSVMWPIRYEIFVGLTIRLIEDE